MKETWNLISTFQKGGGIRYLISRVLGYLRVIQLRVQTEVSIDLESLVISVSLNSEDGARGVKLVRPAPGIPTLVELVQCYLLSWFPSR